MSQGYWITGEYRTDHRNGVRLAPDAVNELDAVSEVLTDIPITTRPDKVHRQIGTLSRDDLERVENTMWLVLDGKVWWFSRSKRPSTV